MFRGHQPFLRSPPDLTKCIAKLSAGNQPREGIMAFRRNVAKWLLTCKPIGENAVLVHFQTDQLVSCHV